MISQMRAISQTDDQLFQNHNTAPPIDEHFQIDDGLKSLDIQNLEHLRFLFHMAQNITSLGNASFGGSGAFRMFSSNFTPVRDYYQTSLDYLNLYFTPVIILSGLLGNLLSLLVFTMTHLKRLSSSLYLSALALADIFFLLALLLVWLDHFHVPLFSRPGLCQVVVYVTDVCGFLAMWMVLGFTTERYILTYHPLKKDKLCNRKLACWMVTALLLFAMAIYSHAFWTHGVIQGQFMGLKFAKCVPMLDYHKVKTIMESIDTVLACIIPSFSIIILNISILVKIHQYQTKRCQSLHTMNSQKLSYTYVRNRSIIHTSISTTGSMHVRFGQKYQLPDCSGGGEHQQLELSEMLAADGNGGQIVAAGASSSGSKMRTALGDTRIKCEQVLKGGTQYRTARMLLVLSSVLVLLTVPTHVIKVQSFFLEGLLSTTATKNTTATKSRSSRKLTESFQLLYFLNFSINFFIYSACGKQFRTGLRRLCRRWRQKLAKCYRIMRYTPAPAAHVVKVDLGTGKKRHVRIQEPVKYVRNPGASTVAVHSYRCTQRTD